MITLNLDTNNLPNEMLSTTYFMLMQEGDECGGMVAFYEERDDAQIKVIHSSMYPGSHEEAYASLISNTRNKLVELGVITGTRETSEILHLDKLTA